MSRIRPHRPRKKNSRAPRDRRRHHPAGQRPDEDPSLAVRNNGGVRAVDRARPRPDAGRRCWCSPSAAPRVTTTSCRSSRTSPAAAASRASGCEDVAEHYHHFGGVSPINEQNKALIAAVEKELAAAGIDLPVYWGNRNWAPYVEDTWRQMADDGIEHVYVFATSAYASFSGCRQYHEDIARARVASGGGPTAEKLPHYFDTPGFVQANADALAAALASLPDDVRDTARLVATAHSIPDSMAAVAGPRRAAPTRPSCWPPRERVVAAVAPGRPFDLVWQSRSGPPSVPWLEPDVNDHLRALAAAGETAVVALPGRLRQRPPRGDLGPRQRGAGRPPRSSGWPSPAPATAGTHPAFVAIGPRAARGAPRRAACPRLGTNCPAACCFVPTAPPRPACPGAPRRGCRDSARVLQTGATSRL